MGIAKAFLLTLLYVVLDLAFQLLSFLIFDTGNNLENEHTRGLTIIVARVVAYFIVFYFFWKPKSEILSFKSELNIPTVGILFLIIIGTEFFNRPFADLERLFDNTPLNYVYEGYSTLQIYAAITALVVAPVFEELFFRKFLFKKLLLKNGFLTSIIISSFLFSVIHWETPLNLIPAFIFGLISAIIFYKTRNIIYCIILHFLYNLSSQLVYFKAELYSNRLNWLNFGILYWSLFFFGIFLILIALKLINNNQSQISSE